MEYKTLGQTQNIDYLNQFIELYIQTFPIESEREDTSTWIDQLSGTEDVGFAMEITFALDNEQVVAGIVTEYYPKSRVGLVTYLLVHPDHRRGNIGRTLFDHAKHAFEDLSHGQIVGMVFEAEDPNHFQGEEHTQCVRRLHFFASLHAYVIDIDYYQPPLNGRTEGCTHLWLLSVGSDEDVPSLKAAHLTAFLNEFYAVLECPIQSDPQAKQAIQSIPPRLSFTQLRKEEAALHFQAHEVAIAHHWSIQEDSITENNWVYPSDPIVRSMELDLMNYAYQINPAFGSETVLAAPVQIDIIFPEMIHYTSEGRRIWYLTQQHSISVEVSLYKTVFPTSQHILWHSTYKNTQSMSAIDLVKFIHLYDGRTEYTDLHNQTQFRYEGNVYPFNRLIELLNTAPIRPPALQGGSMVLSLEHSLLELLNRILDQSSDLSALADQNAHGLLQISELTGVVTGIFDSDELDINEIRDTIVTAHKTSDALYIYHRSTLLHITEADRSLDQDWIGISPYIFVPQALIIHNDVVLQELIEAINDVDAPNASVKELETLANFGDASIEQFFLPNLFMYQTEQQLVQYAYKHRGTHLIMAQAKSRISDIKQVIEMKWDTQQDRGQMLIACVLAAISIIRLEPLFTEIFGIDTLLSTCITVVMTIVVVLAIQYWWTPKKLS